MNEYTQYTNISISNAIACMCATGPVHETLPGFGWRPKLFSCAAEPVLTVPVTTVPTEPVPTVPVTVHTKKHGTEVRSMGTVTGAQTHKFLN